jgi:antitoxin PrlF
MILLTVTERGQVTIRKEVLKHLGIKPGDKIELDLLIFTENCPGIFIEI